VEFLGYVIFRNGIRMDFHKVQTIVDRATPTFVQNVQCFIGFANFYWRFIAHYSSIMAFFTLLIKKDQHFSWGVEADNAFQSLKSSFIIGPFFIHLNPSKLFVLDIDTFNYTIGIVLS